MDMASLVETKRNPKIPELAPGDTVKVSARIVEGGKERIQVFQGVVIKIRRGGASANFTVRHVAYGIGVERTFPLYSPLVEKVEIIRHGKVRRAKLYYLRGLSGKEARRKIKRVDRKAKEISEELLEPEPEEILEPEDVVVEEAVAEEGAETEAVEAVTGDESEAEEAQEPEAIAGEEPEPEATTEETPEPEAAVEEEQPQEEVTAEATKEPEAIQEEPEPEAAQEEEKAAIAEEPPEEAAAMEKEEITELAEDEEPDKETT